MTTQQRNCECEHAAHFHDDEPRTMTPQGNPGHKYGATFDERAIAPVKTTYGTFHVCTACAADCYAEHSAFGAL